MLSVRCSDTFIQMRVFGSVARLFAAAAVLTMGLSACASNPPDPTSGTCCTFTGPVSYDCAGIENLGPGADLDGRCNAGRASS